MEAVQVGLEQLPMLQALRLEALGAALIGELLHRCYDVSEDESTDKRDLTLFCHALLRAAVRLSLLDCEESQVVASEFNIELLAMAKRLEFLVRVEDSIYFFLVLILADNVY
jgi:hypothetical protein